MLHKKYLDLKNDEDSTREELTAPLILLQHDILGNTALDVALQADRPICFELMLDMITNFRDTCTSQMLLKQLPFMIKSQSNVIYKYFD